MTFLGLDIGTGSMKAALWQDGTMEVYSHPYRQGTFLPGFHHDIPSFTESVKEFFMMLLASDSQWEAPECIAISCHGPSLVSLNAQGTPLGPMATWQNRDASEEAQAIRTDDAGFKKDGTSWEAKCRREYFRNPGAASFLYPKDYITFLLTGGKGFDLSTASTLTFFDRHSQSWVAERIGLPDSLFPRVLESHEAVGETGTEFSRSCGLPDGIPVLAGGIDAYCEALGSGAVSVGDLTEGSGTSTCLSVCSGRDRGDIHVVPDRGLVMALISNSGSAIRWLETLTSASSGGAVEAGRAPVGDVAAEPVNTIFLPYLNGERSPFWDGKLQGAFVGLTGNTNRSDLSRAVLQGITFAIRQNLEQLPSDLYHPGSAIFAAGGGAENKVWLQMKADILGHPFLQPEFKDAAPLGDLCLCGYHARMANPSEEMRIRRIRRIFEPGCTPDKKGHYDALYQEYVSLTDSLRTSFHRLSDLNTPKAVNI